VSNSVTLKGASQMKW